MIEKVKPINNPLTIIAIFVMVAEIALTLAIKFVTPELQYIFIWFVMGFPVLIALLFFGTLNFNAKVLYAPSDFKDEQNFITALGIRQLSITLEEVNQQIDTAKKQIFEDVKKSIGITEQSKQEGLKETVDKGLAPVQSSVEDFKWKADVILESVDPARYGIQQHSIMQFLRDYFLKNPDTKKISFDELKKSFPDMSTFKFHAFILMLEHEGYLVVNNGDISITPKLESSFSKRRRRRSVSYYDTKQQAIDALKNP
jgi:hypothetical protein